MITVDKLKEIGIQPEEGLARCLNNEGLYLKLVQTIPENGAFASLRQALDRGDLDAGFEAAHSLKGALGNLSLNTLYDPIADLTEHLRAREEMDYGPLMEQVETALERLKEQCD